MKTFLRAKAVVFAALLASALAVLAATAAPALAKGYMLIPGSHASANPVFLSIVAALGALSVALMGVAIVGARRQRRLASVVSLESARAMQTRVAAADKPSRRRAA
jgi:hypothetical protein